MMKKKIVCLSCSKEFYIDLSGEGVTFAGTKPCPDCGAAVLYAFPDGLSKQDEALRKIIFTAISVRTPAQRDTVLGWLKGLPPHLFNPEELNLLYRVVAVLTIHVDWVSDGDFETVSDAAD